MTHADSIWVNALQAHADSLQSKVDFLQAKLDDLQVKSDLMYNIIEPSNSSIANQLSSITLWIEVIAVLIAVGGGFLTYYIGKKRREVERMAKIVDDKAIIIDNIAKATVELDKKIHSNLSALYKDLRCEETRALLDRLVTSPKDIINLNVILMSRDIENECYDKFRLAYINLKKELEEFPAIPGEDDYLGEYFVLFFQHFFYQAIKDEELSSGFESRYEDIFTRANKRDMIKSTIDLCKALSDDKMTINKENVLTAYLNALNKSEFSNTQELKDILERKLPLGLLDKAIEKCVEEKVYLTLFGIKSPKVEDSEKCV